MFVLGFVIHPKAVFSSIETTRSVVMLKNSFKTQVF